MSVKRLAILSLLLSVAIVLSYLESLIPMFIPGVKLGLANVVILIMLYEFKFYEALLIDLLRIFIVSLIIGSFLNPVFFMSLTGGMLSYLVMLIFSRIKLFSVVGTSILGAISHSLGQIIIASILVSSDLVLYYLPFILLLSIASGILSGFIARLYLKRSPTRQILDNINGSIMEDIDNNKEE